MEKAQQEQKVRAARNCESAKLCWFSLPCLRSLWERVAAVEFAHFNIPCSLQHYMARTLSTQSQRLQLERAKEQLAKSAEGKKTGKRRPPVQSASQAPTMQLPEYDPSSCFLSFARFPATCHGCLGTELSRQMLACV